MWPGGVVFIATVMDGNRKWQPERRSAISLFVTAQSTWRLALPGAVLEEIFGHGLCIVADRFLLVVVLLVLPCRSTGCW